MADITSRQNQTAVKLSLLKEKKGREAQGLFMAEGRKLWLEILQSDIRPKKTVCTDEYFSSHSRELSENTARDDIITVSESVFEKLTQEKAPEGIITVCAADNLPHTVCDVYEEPQTERRLFALSGIQDPGNLGTVIRTAGAFGTDEIILDGFCADLYNHKTIRASMGAIFRMKITVCLRFDETLSLLRRSRRVYAAALDRSAARLDELTILPSDVFVVGNEGHGLSESSVAACTQSVFIPMEQGAESLNASQAATILLWEGYRALKQNRA